MRIRAFYDRSEPTISFEFFPPKTADDEAALFRDTVPGLKALGASFISVTYGAGGGTRESTFRIVHRIRREYGIEAIQADAERLGAKIRRGVDHHILTVARKQQGRTEPLIARVGGLAHWAMAAQRRHAHGRP